MGMIRKIAIIGVIGISAIVLAVGNSSAASDMDLDAIRAEARAQVKREMGSQYGKPAVQKVPQQQTMSAGSANPGTAKINMMNEQKPAVQEQETKQQNAGVEQIIARYNKCTAGVVTGDGDFKSFETSLWGLIVETQLYRDADGNDLQPSLKKKGENVEIGFILNGERMKYLFSIDEKGQYALLVSAESNESRISEQDASRDWLNFRTEQAKRKISAEDVDRAKKAAVEAVKKMGTPEHVRFLSLIKDNVRLMLIPVLLILGCIPALIAKSKGRSFWKWWGYGVVVFIIAFPHSLFLKGKSRIHKDKKEGAKTTEQHDPEKNKEVVHGRYEKDDVYAQIEKLAELKEKGMITRGEYEEKKKELLTRI
ncbi:MAG TPA: SHOCT domain-containing protein [Candidatus Omnitrophota bacterium]|nr:SHOCT domain-containing protein [Candidatus Omnitrophota bacterium]HPS19694.1 SHOCT domain-containing protein [Candidatus Omnitrophota bacterium]